MARKNIIIPDDEEDRRITAAAQADPDNPPLTGAHLSRMKPVRGRQKAPTKERVGIRLDADVVEHFRRTGPGWQARLNARLREALGL